MIDPTYAQDEIRANPEWDLAFVLSEILNDNAPIGWSRHVLTARCLLAAFDIKRKDEARHVATPSSPAPDVSVPRFIRDPEATPLTYADGLHRAADIIRAKSDGLRLAAEEGEGPAWAEDIELLNSLSLSIHTMATKAATAAPDKGEVAGLILGDEIFESLRNAKRADYQYALAVLRRLVNPVSRDTVSDGELVDAAFEFVARLDLANPLLPLASYLLERVMMLTAIEETPRGLKRDYFTEAS